MSIFILLTFIAGITFGGFIITNLLIPKSNFLEKIGYGYGLGVGMIALQLYVYSRFGIAWTKEIIFIPWIILLIIFFTKKRKQISFPKIKFSLSKLQWVLLVTIICALAYTFIEAILRPTSVWDSWAIWLLKAKMFFIDGRINPAALGYIRSDYPVLISLLGTSVYMLLGHVDDTAVLLVFFSFFFFLALLLFSQLRQRFSLTFALLFTMFFVTTQTFIRQGGRIEAGQADLALGYFFFICFSLLVKFMQDKSWKSLLLLSIFLGFTGLVKLDGQPFIFIVLIVLLFRIIKQRKFAFLFFLLISILPIIDWKVYVVINHIQFLTGGSNLFQFPTKEYGTILKKEFFELISIKSWNMLWVIYSYSFLTLFVKRNFELFLAHMLILSQLAVYTFLYIFSSSTYTPESSFERLLVHIAPLALFAIALSSGKIFKQKITASKKS